MDEPASLGRLVGVGVGPGNPGLVTLAALEVLDRADRVFAPSGSIEAVGRAEAIVRQLRPKLAIERLVVELGRPANDAQRVAAYAGASEVLAGHLRAGETVAFVTIGDPNLFSTFTWLVEAVRSRLPSVPVGTVPGITAFQALAATAGTPLADDRQQVWLVTGPDATDAAASVADRPDVTLVIYKAGRHLPDITGALEAAGRTTSGWVGELLGLVGERVTPLPEWSGPASYLSVVLAPAESRSKGSPQPPRSSGAGDD